MERDSESVESDTKDGPTEISGPVNRGGFPVDETTWQKMWDHAAKVHPDGNSAVEQIRGNTALIRVSLELITDAHRKLDRNSHKEPRMAL